MSEFFKAPNRKAWFAWTLLFVPLFAATMFGMELFGFYRVFPIIMTVLATALLYQRYVKKRSWWSIFWGKQAARD